MLLLLLLLLREVYLSGGRVVRRGAWEGWRGGSGSGVEGWWGGMRRMRHLEPAATAAAAAAGASVAGRRGVGAKKVLEDGEVRHGRVHHLREVVVDKLGRDEVPAPELLLGQAPALVHLLLDVAHGAVHGEGHAVARDDGVVDDVRVRELLVHHVERLDELLTRKEKGKNKSRRQFPGAVGASEREVCVGWGKRRASYRQLAPQGDDRGLVAPKTRRRKINQNRPTTYLKVPGSQIGVFGDVFHVYLRMWDARRALRRCMGVRERRRACHKRDDVRRAPVCREQDGVK